MRDFESSLPGTRKPRAAARQSAERSIGQIRRDVYNSHRHRAYALAYYMTGNELEAEDLLARCFTRAFQKKRVPKGADVDASLLEELRVDGVLGGVLGSVLGEMGPGGMPEAGSGLEAGANVRRTDLEEALRELPAAERLIFLLSDVEGYRAARIAKLTGRPEAEIARAVMAARLRVRHAVAELQRARDEDAA